MKTRRLICLLFSLFISFTSFSQTKTVTGKVTDINTGESLPGVNIIVKGTTKGIATGIDGTYKIEVTSNDILVFSYVGMETQEIKVGDRSVIDVKLRESSLSEVVVTVARITPNKQKLASVTTITPADILGGKASGVMAGVRANAATKKEAKTWKRSGGDVNRVRLEIGDKETIPLKSRQIAIKIDGFRARVVMDCYFYNDHERQFEGTFKLRLPNGASPYFFAFGETRHTTNKKNVSKIVAQVNYQKGKQWNFHPDSVMAQRKETWSSVKQARVVPKQKAAHAYTEIANERIDPALMEWSGADVFNCRVFPLMPKKMHHIVIGYDMNLLEIDDLQVLQLALGNQKETTPFKVNAMISNIKTDQLQVLPATTPHQEGSQLHLSWQNPEASEIKLTIQRPKVVLLTSPNNGGAHYFATSFKVDLPKIPKAQFKDNVVFLLDVSLSSQPDKFNVWLKTLISILQNNQDIIKNFSVLCFNVEAFWWKKKQVRNTKANWKRFLRFANRLSLEGATDLGSALDQINQATWLKNKASYLFLLSDGDVTWGEDNLYRLSKKIAAKNELYAFSTGLSGTDPRILDYLTRSSKGAVFSIVNEDEVAQVSQMFRHAPWRIQQMTMPGAGDFLLAGRPQYLYAGQRVILAGRYQSLDKPTIKIQVAQNNQKKAIELQFTHQLSSELSKRIYGQIATTQLESLGQAGQKEAIQYAVHFQVPGQTCSFVMLENERAYRRFGIKKEDNQNFIEEHLVGDLLAKLITHKNDQLSNEKKEFGRFLEQLAKGETGVKLDFNESFKALFERMSPEHFKIKVPHLKGQNRSRKKVAEQVLIALMSDNLDFKVISKAAIKRSTKNKAEAIRLLSSLIEKNPGDVNLLRMVAYSIMEWGMAEHCYFIFKKMIEQRPAQPAAYQLISQVLQQMGYHELALLYYEVALQVTWDDDYDGIKDIIKVEYLHLLNKMLKNKTSKLSNSFLSQRLMRIKTELKTAEYFTEQADLLVTITWSTDNTDVDLHVKEASGETCYYKHDRTKAGGHLSKDMTEGFGPEMYFLNQASKGNYEVLVKYFSDNENRYQEKTKVYLCIYRNWGKDNEEVIRKIVTLAEKKEKQKMAELKF